MNTKQNIITDISTLTRIPKKSLEELTNKINLCIGSAIHDALSMNEPVVLINIGIGTLSISTSDMQCKFIPSKDLKATIKKCLDTKVDPLELQLEEAITEKLISLCEEVF